MVELARIACVRARVRFVRGCTCVRSVGVRACCCECVRLAGVRAGLRARLRASVRACACVACCACNALAGAHRRRSGPARSIGHAPPAAGPPTNKTRLKRELGRDRRDAAGTRHGAAPCMPRASGQQILAGCGECAFGTPCAATVPAGCGRAHEPMVREVFAEECDELRFGGLHAIPVPAPHHAVAGGCRAERAQRLKRRDESGQGGKGGGSKNG
jgi:hypothetical protein